MLATLDIGSVILKILFTIFVPGLITSGISSKVITKLAVAYQVALQYEGDGH
jgi:hypothetical protein